MEVQKHNRWGSFNRLYILICDQPKLVFQKTALYQCLKKSQTFIHKWNFRLLSKWCKWFLICAMDIKNKIEVWILQSKSYPVFLFTFIVMMGGLMDCWTFHQKGRSIGILKSKLNSHGRSFPYLRWNLFYVKNVCKTKQT